MSRSHDNLSIGETVVELETDFPTIACEAAIELDNLLLGREPELHTVRILIQRISDSIPADQHLATPALLVANTTETLVLGNAIRDSFKPGLATIDQLVEEARAIAKRLSDLLENPQSFLASNREELRRLSSFCLALSKQASASHRFHSKRSEPKKHPYRR